MPVKRQTQEYLIRNALRDYKKEHNLTNQAFADFLKVCPYPSAF